MDLLALLLFLQMAHPHKVPRKPAPAPPPAADIANTGIFGTWIAHDKSMFEIYPCGVTNGEGGDPKEACVRLLKPSAHTSPDEPDVENPDPNKRQRPLTFMPLGTGYKVSNPASDPEAAAGGKLYDPDNGRTYSSTITLKGNQLKLHGSRFLFFGHTITLHRVTLPKPSPYKRR